MTFPTIPSASYIGVYNNTALNPHTAVSFPATVDANQLLIYFGGNDGTGDTCTISGPTILMNPAVNAQGNGAYAYYETAVGNEDGGTYTVTPTSLEELVAYCLAIDGWDGVTAPEISSIANGSSTAPNPPSITPSWGAEDTLFIAVTTWNLGAGTVGYPTNYDDNQNTQEVTGAINGCAFATRAINGSPENPGVFSFTSSTGWQAFTIAVRSASAGNPWYYYAQQ